MPSSSAWVDDWRTWFWDRAVFAARTIASLSSYSLSKRRFGWHLHMSNILVTIFRNLPAFRARFCT